MLHELVMVSVKLIVLQASIDVDKEHEDVDDVVDDLQVGVEVIEDVS